MNYNKIINKFKKNSKGLSPVVASIILIAVTVAVSVVVAAWMGGMTIGLMGNAEQATVTNIGFSTAVNSTRYLVVTVSNTGNSQITITNAYVNTVAALPPTEVALPLDVAKETSANVVIGGTAASWISGTEYTVKLTTAEGNNLVLSAFAP